MSTEIASPEASPVETATPGLEDGLLSDEQLAEIFGTDEEPEKPVETPAKPTEEKPAVAEEVKDGLDLKALDELDKGEPKAETPAVTPDSEYLKKVQNVFPNEEALGWGIDAFQRIAYVDNAAKAGNLDAVLSALPSLKPIIQQTLMNYVKANEDKIIEAYIRKHNPEHNNPEVNDLKQRLTRFETEQANQKHQEATQRQQAEYASRVKAIDTEVTALFDRVRFTKTEADRKIVSSLFKVALAENGDAFQKALKGDLTALRPLFSKAVREFTAADKAKTLTTPVQTPTTPNKPILAGAGNAVSGGEPDVWQKAANYVANVGRRKTR